MERSNELLRGLGLQGYRQGSGELLDLAGIYLAGDEAQLRLLGQFLIDVAEQIDLGDLFDYRALVPFDRPDLPNVVVLHPHTAAQEADA